MRVQIVEDSKVVQTYLVSVLGSEPGVEIIGPIDNGVDAVKVALRERPDIILMDLGLPRMGGLEAIEHIMAERPCPILVLSALVTDDNCKVTFDALRLGAVDVMRKPGGMSPQDVAGFRERLLRRLKLLARVRVIRRRRKVTPPPQQTEQRPIPLDKEGETVLLIGASTGGPAVLYDLLSRIPAPCQWPIVIAQHILPGFDHRMATWLRESGHDVRIAVAGDRPRPGQVLVAPSDSHTAWSRGGSLQTLAVAKDALSPSVDRLFSSAADVLGGRVIAVLLTGMGDDGAEGMLELRQQGAITIAQRADTCIVNGMPGAAVALGAAEHILAPADIAAWLRGTLQATAGGRNDGGSHG